MYKAGGYDFVIDKDLYTQAAPLKVDMTYMGFSIESSLQIGGGSCGSSCSSGSCSC